MNERWVEGEMKVLIFHMTDDDPVFVEQLGNLVEQFQHDEISVCTDIADLQSKLQQIVRRPDVAVLFASTSEELNRLVEMKDHFFNIALIVILKDFSSENINLGYKLHPRFLSTMNENLSVIPDILSKMKEKTAAFAKV